MPTFSYINDVLFIEYLCHRVPEEEGEEEKVRAPPTFVSKPEPVTVEEGDCSRFCCRVTGHPRPRVMWIDPQWTYCGQCKFQFLLVVTGNRLQILEYRTHNIRYRLNFMRREFH